MWLTMQLLLPFEFNVGWPAASDQLLYVLVRPLRLRQPEMETTTPDSLSLATNYIYTLQY
jgi:hypothetical protein